MSHNTAAFMAIAALWSGGSHLATASEGLQHLSGTVQAISVHELRIQTTEPRTLTLVLDAQTRYEHHGKAAAAGDLKPGTRLVVEAEDVGGRLFARVVHIEQAPMDKAPSHAGHAMGTPMPPHNERALFQSDMARMAGMTPRDPMAGMAMPGWQFMTMGIARLHYNHQGGPSGDDAVESVNWGMVMLQRDLGPGRVTLMMMNSLEPATFEEGGSPQLFQTGETFEGRPIVDRQHPHDLFMNLSATYRKPFGAEGAYWLQAGLRGEPTLGPTAFMHRASAGENPTAPLGHHLQDSTHIADAVITAGIGWDRVSGEVSVFHGKEPDEDRWDLDLGPLDSVAGRVRVELPRGWSAQISHGFLSDPEALEEGDTRRTTASLHYGAAGDRPLAATLLWGRNREEHGTFDSVLLEGAYQLTRNDHVYARAEHVDKDLQLLEKKDLDPANEGGQETVGIGALTVGYLRDVRLWDALRTGLGADVTLYSFPRELDDVYGESPASFRVFLRLRWDHGHGNAGGHEMRH